MSKAGQAKCHTYVAHLARQAFQAATWLELKERCCSKNTPICKKFLYNLCGRKLWPFLSGGHHGVSQVCVCVHMRSKRLSTNKSRVLKITPKNLDRYLNQILPGNLQQNSNLQEKRIGLNDVVFSPNPIDQSCCVRAQPKVNFKKQNSFIPFKRH